MTTNLIGLAWNVVWYIQCFWHVVKWIGHDRETNEEQENDCVEEGFQLARKKLDGCGEEGRIGVRVVCCSIII